MHVKNQIDIENMVGERYDIRCKAFRLKICILLFLIKEKELLLLKHRNTNFKNSNHC